MKELKAPQPGGYYCRDLAVPSGADGLHPAVYHRERMMQDQFTYDCPQLEPILEPTYGCIVYQEQVMQIVRDLAGYTLGRSDLLRRAMSKKKGDVMQKGAPDLSYMGTKRAGVPGCIN